MTRQGWLPKPGAGRRGSELSECQFAVRGQGTDIRAVVKRRSALLSRRFCYHSGNLLGHMLSGKDRHSMNRTSLKGLGKKWRMACNDFFAAVKRSVLELPERTVMYLVGDSLMMSWQGPFV